MHFLEVDAGSDHGQELAERVAGRLTVWIRLASSEGWFGCAVRTVPATINTMSPPMKGRA
jgi:hypothetical protein